MRKVRLIFAVALCLFVIAPFAFSAGSAELKVGTLMAQTGPLAEYGPAIQNGAVLAAKQLGEAGMEVTLIHEDSETNPIPAVTARHARLHVTTAQTDADAQAARIYEFEVLGIEW